MARTLDDVLGPEIPRDRWDRPLIIPPDGGKPIPYARASSFAKTLDDAGGLVTWKARMVALGVAQNEDLAAIIAGHEYGPKLDEWIEQAHDRAGGNAKANWGTAVHLWTDRYADPEAVGAPKRMQADVDAYLEALEHAGFVPVVQDRFVVNDELGVAGTFDSIVKSNATGAHYIEDRKTGSLHPLGVAVQLACYAGGEFYELRDDGMPLRTPFVVSQDFGICSHVPAGKGECTLYEVDLRLGRAAARLALEVRSWRKRTDLLHALD